MRPPHRQAITERLRWLVDVWSVEGQRQRAGQRQPGEQPLPVPVGRGPERAGEPSGQRAARAGSEEPRHAPGVGRRLVRPAGDGTTTNRATPVQVAGLSGVTLIGLAAGGRTAWR